MKVLQRSDKEKNTLKAIEKYWYDLWKTVSKRLKAKISIEDTTHYSQFSSESATPSRRKTLLALEVTPPVSYANLDIF